MLSGFKSGIDAFLVVENVGQNGWRGNIYVCIVIMTDIRKIVWRVKMEHCTHTEHARLKYPLV